MDRPLTPAEPDLSSLPDSLRPLATRGVAKRYPKGVVLIHEGDVGDTLYLILQGRVKAYSSDDGEREIVYGIYGPGEYFGEMSLDGGLRSASVATLEATVCVLVTRHSLQEHIGQHPDFAFELLTRVIRRARMATLSARNMALLDVYGRVVKLLGDMAVTDRDGRRVISPRLTHAELAHCVGCSREMVSRLMKDLQQGGYIVVERNGLVLQRLLPSEW